MEFEAINFVLGDQPATHVGQYNSHLLSSCKCHLTLMVTVSLKESLLIVYP